MATIDIFKEAVLNSYWDMKYKGELSSLLESPSPANLRDYSRIRLSQGLAQDDIKVLQEFFNPKSKYDTLDKAIEKIEPEKLKPLQNFINKVTNKPKELIVKLLAVLIDFQPRPFRISDWTDKPKELHDNSDIAEEPEDTPPSMPTASPKPTGTFMSTLFNQLKTRIAYATGVAAIGLSIMWGIKIYSKQEQCMLWQGESYIVVDCRENPGPPHVLGLDEDILNSFQRITRPDTLTVRHENKVWYSKIDNEVEFFTTIGFGFHPEFTDRSLKAATRWILEKYAGRNVVATDSPTNEME